MAFAQKEVELQEVTVQGSKVVQRVDGQTIHPTRQQLESSTNGYSLLSKLTLPHLRVDPVMHSVTALSNLGSVQVRINDIAASKEDLLALDIKAVQHIDYIDNPGVRYGEGVAYVINIIVKKPVSGYNIGADLTNTLTSVNGDETVYGKFNYGKSEFGVNYSLGYQNFEGTEYEEKTTYELEPGTDGCLRRLRQSCRCFRSECATIPSWRGTWSDDGSVPESSGTGAGKCRVRNSCIPVRCG